MHNCVLFYFSRYFFPKGSSSFIWKCLLRFCGGVVWRCETFQRLTDRQLKTDRERERERVWKQGGAQIPLGQEQIYSTSTMVKTECKEQSLCCISGDKQLRAVIIVFLTHSAFSSLSSLLAYNTGVLMFWQVQLRLFALGMSVICREEKSVR